MNTAAKTLEAMRANPRGNWSMQDLLTVATRHDLSVRSTGGSHHVFFNEAGRSLSVPARRPIKPVYIKQFLTLLD